MSECLAWGRAEGLSAGVDGLLAVGLAGVEDVEPLAQVVEEVARKVAAVQQRLVAELVARGVAEGRGLSPAEHLRVLLRLSPVEAKGRVERAADVAPRRALFGVILPAWSPGRLLPLRSRGRCRWSTYGSSRTRCAHCRPRSIPVPGPRPRRSWPSGRGSSTRSGSAN